MRIKRMAVLLAGSDQCYGYAVPEAGHRAMCSEAYTSAQ